MINKTKENNDVYSIKEYILNESIITIKAKHHEVYEHMVYSYKFRKEISNDDYTITQIGLANANHFFEDLDFIFSHIQNKEFTLQSAWDAYFNLTGNHIDKFGRLIDNDLEGYLDRILLAMEAISLDTGMAPLEESDGIKIRDDFRNGTFKAFENYIWITRNTSDIDSSSPFEIVRYKDL